MADYAPEFIESGLAAFEKAEAQEREWLALWPMLQEQFPQQFVAIKDHEVVAADPDLLALVDRLEYLGLTPASVLLRFVRTDWDRLIL